MTKIITKKNNQTEAKHSFCIIQFGSRNPLVVIVSPSAFLRGQLGFQTSHFNKIFGQESGVIKSCYIENLKSQSSLEDKLKLRD